MERATAYSDSFSFFLQKTHKEDVSSLLLNAHFKFADLLLGVSLLSPAVFFLPFLNDQLCLLITIVAALVLSINREFTGEYILGNRILYFVGEMSYTVYLFHCPIILFIKYYTEYGIMDVRGCP